MRIVELRAENFKRLKAVNIRPDGSLVIVAGENDQGKSSVLDSIEAALGGSKSVPSDPIRKGKRRGRNVVDLGDLVVERQYSPTGSKLVVKNRAGETQKSPQSLLDDLCDKLAFDPQEFARLEREKRTKVVKELVGLDFTKLDGQRSAAYSQRTDVNKDVKRLEAKLDLLEVHDGVPEGEVSVAELTAELGKREEQLAGNGTTRKDLEDAEKQLTGTDEAIVEAKAEVATLRQQLEEAEGALTLREEERAAVLTVRDDAQELVDELKDPDLEDVKRQMAESDETNRKVRENQEHARVAKELEDKEDEAQTLTDEIAEVDDQKQQQIADAEFPIEGLGFDEDGVTLDGVPFDQASESQRLMASVAVGAALHPKLRVLLIRNGNDLGEQKLQALAEMAEKLDLQIWLERIAGGPGAVVIEDGVVADVETRKAG